jgi:diguanylate cyclase (GGDEF)-like protein
MPDGEGRQIDANFIKHYEVLSKIGVWDELQNLASEIKLMEELFSQAIDIFNAESLQTLIDLVISRLLNKFIPSNLLFIIDDPASGLVHRLLYKNLVKSNDQVALPDLEIYREFFKANPHPVAFSLFDYRVERKEAVEALKPFRPEILVPMTGLGGIRGFTVFGEKRVNRGYSQPEISYLHKLMSLVSIAVQNFIHHRISITDLKTQLYNHAHFITRLQEEICRVKRYGGSLAALVIDIDFFKRFNDGYGHLAGDQMLAAVAHTLKTGVRSEDVVARFGGEEFVVLLINADRRTAIAAAERLREAVAAARIGFNDQELGVTISIGGASMDKTNLKEPREILELADQALYRSKTNGRDRVTFEGQGLLWRADILRALPAANPAPASRRNRA